MKSSMSKEDLIKFRNRTQAEIRVNSVKGVAKVICFDCGRDCTEEDCRCRAGKANDSHTKMMSVADSTWQHLTGIPVM
jgi:hypothetical protein